MNDNFGHHTIDSLALGILQDVRARRLDAEPGKAVASKILSGPDAVFPASVALQLTAAGQPSWMGTPVLVLSEDVPVSTGPVASVIPFRERPGLTAEFAPGTASVTRSNRCTIACSCTHPHAPSGCLAPGREDTTPSGAFWFREAR